MSEALDATTEAIIEGHADAIRKLAARSGHDIVEIGERLIAVKEHLPHGRFGPWIEREFGWGDETARNFMRVAAAFGQNPKVLGFGPSVLYALSAPGTPADVREQFVAKAEAGESVRHRDVQDAIAATKPPRTEPVVSPTVQMVEQPAPTPTRQSPPNVTYQSVADETPLDDEPSRDIGAEEPDDDDHEEWVPRAEDDNGDGARQRIRSQFLRGMTHATEIINLKPEAIAEAADEIVRHEIDYQFPHLRMWMASVEQALPRGLRRVV